MLAYFGQEHAGGCGHCDNCLKPPDVADATVDAQKLISAIARAGQRFGFSHVINVLRGSKAQKLLDYKHDELTVYGIGADQSAAYWRQLGEHLLQEGLLATSADQYRTVHLTPESRAVLIGEREVSMAQSRVMKRAAAKRPAIADDDGGPVLGQPFGDAGADAAPDVGVDGAPPDAGPIDDVAEGARLFLMPHADGNTFACNTCHALTFAGIDGSSGRVGTWLGIARGPILNDGSGNGAS